MYGLPCIAMKLTQKNFRAPSQWKLHNLCNTTSYNRITIV
jgi:hypothetical protein